ncbi:Ubiquitin-protein ligase E3B [Dinochytrium kinnereticum]|nr:Ubiquitin-protein ligase E3B [Dinochytrium kinnereticum]
MEKTHHEQAKAIALPSTIDLKTPEVKIEKASTLADLVFGSVAGIAGKLVEYPFDTIKPSETKQVRLQTQPLQPLEGGGSTFAGPLDCFLRTVRNEGFRGLYTGLSAPLVGSMIENSGLFLAYNQVQSLVRFTTSSPTADPAAPLSIPQLCLSGFLSGSIVSFVLTPVELVKCKLQVQGVTLHGLDDKSLSKPIYKGPFDILSKTLKARGFFGLYQGHTGTFLRESGGGAAWFGTYEYVCKQLIGQDPTRNTKEDLSTWHLMGAGALAGMAYNLTLFPADVIKSRQQTMEGSGLLRSGFLQVASDLYRAQGIKGFYRGCGITVARSAPTSAVIFATYPFHFVAHIWAMDFKVGTQQKETVAQRARRERQEREVKKKAEEESGKKAAASLKIQSWYRNARVCKKTQQSIADEWDSWMGYQGQDDSPATIGDIIQCIGVFLRFYVTDKNAHVDRLSFLCKQLLKTEELKRLTALFEGPRFQAASKVFSDLLWVCLERSCEGSAKKSSAGSDGLYLIGSELRLLITVWDVRKWIKSDKGQKVALQSRRAVIDRGLFPLVAGAMQHRVYVILRTRFQKTRDAADEKRSKNCLVWLTAALHLSIVSLEKAEDGNADAQEAYLSLFLVSILSLPFLSVVLDRNGLDSLVKNLDLISVTSLLRSNQRFLRSVLDSLPGERALCFAANVTVLFKFMTTENKEPVSKKDLQTLIWILSRTFDECNAFIATSATNKCKYHPIFQWYSGPSLGIPNEFYPLLTDNINYLRNVKFIQSAFSELLDHSIPDTVSALLENKTSLFGLINPQRTQAVKNPYPLHIESGAILLSRFFLNLCRAFQTMRLHILNVLGWTPGLISQIWRLICANHTAYLEVHSRDPELLDVLQLFCEICSVLFLTLDDEDLYERQNPFSLKDLSAICVLLNNFCFSVYRTSVTQSEKGSNQRLAIAESSKKLLSLLYDKNERRAFGSDGLNWIKKEAQKSSFQKEVLAGKPEALSVLEHIPHTIPFSARVEIFRSFVSSEASSRTNSGITVTINRTRVLEDGFAQLRGVAASRLKAIIRVKFVNQYGLPEAGIDQNGVFKEFLEDICKRAFATDFNLFRVTPDGNCIPSLTSSIHEEHLYLFDFIGKMLGKALLEGIVIDIPFATFIYAKMLGKMTFLEDLPSLDAQLYKNMLFLKHYNGDAEDLGLSFTVDSDVFGEIQSKEIKPGGRNIEVTNDNKYEYIHLVSDYKLNQECKDQFRALIGGFRSMIPEQYLHIFSPTELKRLMSGDTIDIDIKDLRSYCRYEGGYYDAHPTIRSLWQIIQDFEVSERRAFLKFVTSCSSPPVGGFQYLDPPFTIRFVEGGASDDPDAVSPLRALGSFLKLSKDASRLPTAATCFNLLKLPAYSKKSTLKAKLTLAIKSASGFELS